MASSATNNNNEKQSEQDQYVTGFYDAVQLDTDLIAEEASQLRHHSLGLLSLEQSRQNLPAESQERRSNSVVLPPMERVEMGPRSSSDDMRHRPRMPSTHAVGMRPAAYAIMAAARRDMKKQRSQKRMRLSVHTTADGEKAPLVSPPLIREEGNQVLVEQSLAALLYDMVFGKWVSFLLVFMPVGYVAHACNWPPAAVFWFNFLAMIPMASILGDFTEEVAAHTNETIGGLVNATFGNAVEVVVAIQALLHNEIRVVQASMIGSIFSNLLLVLGCCFFFGGIKYKEQAFNSTAATANMGLLALSSMALVLPTPFAAYYVIEDVDVLAVSRIAAIFLMCMYLQLLIFQLRTHTHLFVDGDVGDGEVARIPFAVSLFALFFTTLLIAYFSEFLVASIDGFCENSGISRTFVGLIILPIVGNAVEHLTAVSVAMKNKMDLAMGVAVGSCTQIALFVVPLTVLIGWAVDRDMTLNFPTFEIMLYVMSVVTVSICLSNPRSNWLEGSLLITTYIMIAVGFWHEKVVNY